MTPAARAVGRLSLSWSSWAPSAGPLPVWSATPPPAGCSRYMSCSCCRSTASKTFFSPNQNGSREPLPPPRPESSHPLHGRSTLVDHNPEFEPHGASTPKALALPLPPRLPYSPTSVPFKRHLNALSLAILSSSPQESWDVYLSLHPSLRRYIPDGTYRSLIAQQLDEGRPKQRWIRVRSLIEFGQTCGMTLDGLGMDLVETALEAGLVYAVAVKQDSEGMLAILGGLWAALRRMKKGDLSGLDIHVKRRWIELHRLYLENWHRATMSDHSQNRSAVLKVDIMAVIKDFVHTTGGSIGDIGGLLLASASRGAERERALSCMIWCLSQGVEIPNGDLERIIEACKRGLRPREFRHMCQAACQDVPDDIRERVQAVLERTLGSSSTMRLTEAIQAREGFADSHRLIPLAMRILESQSPSIAELSTVFSLCQRLHAIQDVDASDRLDDLYTFFAIKLHRASRGKEPPKALILQFASEFATASTNPTFLHRVFDCLLPLTSPEAYVLARRAYAQARGASTPYTWTRENLSFWRTFFLRVISSQNRHFHFASRLYADLLADGIRPRRQDHFALIRGISMLKSASRPILLERHIRDFIEHHPDHRVALVRILVEGLTAGELSDDALLGWTLTQRLLSDLSRLPPEPALALVKSLAQSPKARYRQGMLDIIARLPQSVVTAEMYDIAITSVILHGRESPRHSLDLPADQALALAGRLLRDMTALQLTPTSRTSSALMRGLIETDRLDNALSLLRTVSKSAVRIKSGVVGRLMIRLALEERYDDADEVERVWRASFRPVASAEQSKISARDLYDKGVVGARVFMDIKRGRPVDLDHIAQTTGWIPNKPFAAYLATIRQEAPADLGHLAVEELLHQDTLDPEVPTTGATQTLPANPEPHQAGTAVISSKERRTHFGLAHPNISMVAF